MGTEAKFSREYAKPVQVKPIADGRKDRGQRGRQEQRIAARAWRITRTLITCYHSFVKEDEKRRWRIDIVERKEEKEKERERESKGGCTCVFLTPRDITAPFRHEDVLFRDRVCKFQNVEFQNSGIFILLVISWCEQMIVMYMIRHTLKDIRNNLDNFQVFSIAILGSES